MDTTKKRNRVEPGIPEGGRFAEEIRSEPTSGPVLGGVGYPTGSDDIADSLLDPSTRPERVSLERFADTQAADTTRRELVWVCEDRHPLEDSGVSSLPTLTREEAYDEARQVLPNLDDNEFDYRWGRVEMAHARMAAFACPEGADMVDDLRPSEEAISYDDAKAETAGDSLDAEAYAQRLSAEWSKIYTAALDEAVCADAEAGGVTSS